VLPAWVDARDFLGDMSGWFALGRTAGQKVALYVVAEKDTLRRMFTDWLATSASRSWSYADSAPGPTSTSSARGRGKA
jgi:hypothetical protein